MLLDEICHCLQCPVLWNLATQKLGPEDSSFIGERLCLRNPSVQKLRTLALVHFIYRACKFDSDVIKLMYLQNHFPNVAPPWRLIQDHALGFARASFYYV